MVASSQRKKEIIILTAIILLASFLRLYRIYDYTTFLGDEGRDALVIKRMIVDHKLRLIGPVTSIGNMYLGPLYYYLITPAMVFSSLSPVGPAVMVALLGVVTVGLIWWVGWEFFGPAAGLIAASLLAISPVVIIYSRSSWNPNVMPFFALLTIYGLWRIWQKQQFTWLAVLGVTLSFAAQSHYLGLLLFPTVGLFWLAALIGLSKKKRPRRRFFLFSFSLVLLFFVLTILPLVWFDLRHGFINTNAFKEFFTVRQTTVNLKVYKAIPKLWDLTTQIFTRLLTGGNKLWGKWVAAVVLIGVIINIIAGVKEPGEKKFLKANPALALVLVWFLVGLLGLGSYKQHIYDHYFGFIFPVPFLLAGLILGKLWAGGKAKKLMAAFGLVSLILFAFKELPLRFPPNRQLERTKEVARFIYEKAKGEPFNLALIAERNYDDAYVYFLEIWGFPPTRIEPLKTEETITDQLFVICEQIPCQPINHPKAEIAMFGWAKIDQKWDVAGTEVYRLVPNPPLPVEGT